MPLAPVLPLFHVSPVNAVAFSPDGRLLVSASADHSVRLWDLVTGKPLRILVGHSAWVLGIDFSPDGRLLASGAEDKTLRLWDPATGKRLHTLEGARRSGYERRFQPGRRPTGQCLA